MIKVDFAPYHAARNKWVEHRLMIAKTHLSQDATGSYWLKWLGIDAHPSHHFDLNDNGTYERYVELPPDAADKIAWMNGPHWETLLRAYYAANGRVIK